MASQGGATEPSFGGFSLSIAPPDVATAAARALVGWRRTHRTWVAYVSSASVAFAGGSIGLYQTVAARLAPGGAAVPTTRQAINRDATPPRRIEGAN